MMKKPVLTISMLCSGRTSAKKSLDSLEKLREKVPCELIIVDTGCDGNMKKLIADYADEIIPFQWCNDFAKARNAGLERANGEWFMFLDDDESFIDTEAIEVFFLTGDYKNYGSAGYIVRSYSDEEKLGYKDSYLGRLTSLAYEVKFSGIIHENFEPVWLPEKQLSSMAEHFGYVYKTPEEKKAHDERNLRLLKKALAEDSESIRMWMHLAQQYYTMGDYRNLRISCEEALLKFEDRDELLANRYRGSLYCGLVDACICLGDHKAAKLMYERALADRRNTDYCLAKLFTLGEFIYEYSGDKETAELYCRRYLELWDHYKTRPEELHMQTAILVDSAFHPIIKNQMYCHQICREFSRRLIDSLKKYFDEFGWDDQQVCMTAEFLPALARAMAELPFDEIFSHAADIIIDRSGTDNFWKEVNKIEKREELDRIIKVFSEMTEGNGGVAALHLREMMLAEERDNWEEFSAALKEAVSVCPQLGGILKRYARFYGEKRLKDAGKAHRAEKEVLSHPDASDSDRRAAEESGNCQNTVSSEMQALAKQIKERINMLLSQGMRDEALQTLRQLREFIPEDRELSELEMKIRSETEAIAEETSA